MFEKYKKSLIKFDMISKDTQKIVIAMSGGKDCQILTTFMVDYRDRVRPDLELEMITAPIPDWKYFPERHLEKFVGEDKQEILINQRRLIERNKDYWNKKGVPTIEIERVAGIDDDKISDSNDPCTWCYIATKKAMFKYLKDHNNSKNTRFAIGLTKWDSIYMMISQMLRGQGWEDVKQKYPEIYNVNKLHIASFSPYPKLNLGIPGKTVYQIQPLIEFVDVETKALATKMNFPLIPDICQDLHGSRFQSDKRHFDRFLKATALEAMNVGSSCSPLFAEYEKMIEMFNNTKVLPPVDELHNVLYDGYNKELLATSINDE
jgi:hypothetical protein